MMAHFLSLSILNVLTGHLPAPTPWFPRHHQTPLRRQQAVGATPPSIYWAGFDGEKAASRDVNGRGSPYGFLVPFLFVNMAIKPV